MLRRVAIFLGQSNAMNFSTYGVSYPGGWTADSDMHIWGNGGYETYNPGNNTQNAGFWGPEAGYIKAFKADRKPQVPLYIIKHSIGSCGLAKNSGGIDFNPYSDGDQYVEAFNKIVDGLNGLFSETPVKKPFVASFFVVNGETDSLTQADAEAYLNNMKDFIEGFRQRLWVHDAKCVIARIQSGSPNGSYASTIRSAQDEFGTGFRQATIDIDDLTPLSNNHISPANAIVMGERFYAAEKALG